MRRLIDWSLTLLLAALAAGCGGGGLKGEKFPVSGTVTLEGKPLAYAQIEFSQDATQGELRTAVVKDGKFSMPAEAGLPEGKYSVCLLPYVPEADEMDKLPPESRREITQASELVPEHFRRRGSLTAIVERGGTSALSFDLTKSP